MPRHTRPLAAVLLLAIASACTVPASQPEAPAMPSSEPAVHGFVTDMPAFDRFVAGKPTPAQLKARYPDLTLVLPGQIATKEYRLNNSRYFPQLDAEGRIVGGKFQ